MRPLDKALELAARGTKVFPVLPNKHPACAHGFRDASADPAVVRRLFERAPAADRIGMPTGAITGIAVIDVDPAGLGWLGASQRRFAEPTRVHSTPRGGRHLFFVYPEGLRCSTGKVAKGVDIRAQDGCCTIWGPGYEVLDDSPPSAFPKFVLRRLVAIERAAAKRQREFEAKFQGESDPEAEARLADVVSRGTNGERNNLLHWAACRAGEKNLSGASLIAAAVSVGLTYPEARATVLSGLRRGRMSR